MPNPYWTPEAKKKEGYEDYDLSPPKLPDRKRRTFEQAVKAIKNDFNELKVEWVEKEEKQEVVVWSKIREDDSEVELPSELCRILLFLYSRNFKKHVNKDQRRAAVKDMLKKGRIRKVILQVIACTGDNSLSFNENYRGHYIRGCLTIHRYFQQTGATGFVSDMSNLTYYWRMQKVGSCFLQAACVAISYLLQACGKPVPPPNASRLIRHHFDDEQLIKYIEDHGGDSVGIFKILEEKFFVCQQRYRDPIPFNCSDLDRDLSYKSATEMLEKGPGLVSKFAVPDNFVCSPPSSNLKEKWPDLAPYENWDKIPANLIPPGVARFTRWNEPAEFIPLNAPSDAGLPEKEIELEEKWKELLCQPAEDDDRLTAVTASISAESSYGSQGTPSERSTTANASIFMDDDSDGEGWSHFLNDDEDDSSSASYSSEDHEPGEGAETPLHAMVLLGHRIVDGSGYWLLQNSWEGPSQIIEVTTEYLIESGAFLYFYRRDTRSPKPEHEWNIKSSSFFCPSPVAACSRLERSDCESWTDDLVHSVPQQKEVLDLEDFF